MVDGILLDAARLNGKVKGGRAGAEIAGKRYIGYEIGVTDESIHVYGDRCNADIRDEEFRYLVVPLDAVRGLELKDRSDRGLTLEIHAIDDRVVLHSENQTRLTDHLERVYRLLARLLS